MPFLINIFQKLGLILNHDRLFHLIDLNFDESNIAIRGPSKDETQNSKKLSKQLARLILESKQEEAMEHFEKHLEDIIKEEENFDIPINIERGRWEVEENIVQVGLKLSLFQLNSKELKGDRDSVPLNEVVTTCNLLLVLFLPAAQQHGH